MNAMSHTHGLSLARCNTRFCRGNERASRETGTMAGLVRTTATAGVLLATGTFVEVASLVCARAATLNANAVAKQRFLNLLFFMAV
ncbi:hypothetical protein D3C83_94840 [compost metagenome]